MSCKPNLELEAAAVSLNSEDVFPLFLGQKDTLYPVHYMERRPAYSRELQTIVQVSLVRLLLGRFGVNDRSFGGMTTTVLKAE